MRCRFCREPAGWMRRRCLDCRKLLNVVASHHGTDMGALLESLVATGVPREKVDRFLNADPNGTGTVRDQMVADATNELMRALGQRGHQTRASVKRIRERGGWMGLDRRPSE